jgi:enoyl-CoA hydratase/carnithine racemase
MRAQLLREDGLGILRIDNPPVNALSPETTADIFAAFAAFEADPSLAALIVECAGRTFVAGGDIAAFENKDFSAAPFNQFLARLEASPRPIIAALFGTVLGGGLELAMACHIRFAHPATQLGMPEVTLGLLPGSLGTQRLPRLVGLALAAKMISDGKPIGAAQARDAGLVDALADDPAVAARAAARSAVPRRASALPQTRPKPTQSSRRSKPTRASVPICPRSRASPPVCARRRKRRSPRASGSRRASLKNCCARPPRARCATVSSPNARRDAFPACPPISRRASCAASASSAPARWAQASRRPSPMSVTP